MSLELQVNGARHKVTGNPRTPLLFVLRNELGLTAAKLGCGKEQCGACAVMVDGKARLSCVDAAESFAGKVIRTSEGLQDAPVSERLREALVANSAAQCGYCTPGIFVALSALFEARPHASDREIRDALQPHLCRCGSHIRILRAARAVAGAI